MRKIEMVTLFDTDYLVVPNNLLLTHSLTHSLYSLLAKKTLSDDTCVGAR